jgi:cytochrome c-type biogenesis protein CcmH
MTLFALFATLIVVAVVALILPSLWVARHRETTADDRRTANLAIFRDQLAELDREKAEGTLAEADFEQAQRELQRRLLEEVEPDEAAGNAAVNATSSRKTAIVLMVLLPVLAVAGYLVLGSPRALDPTQTMAQPKMTPEKIQAMVESLAERMRNNPDDVQGWLMLARSYKALGRHADAAAAYAKVEKEVEKDPAMLTDYAEALAMSSPEGLKGKPLKLVEKALRLDPKSGHALFLAGAAAMEAGENKKGIDYWERLLPMVEPGSELDQMLRQGIDRMKQGK